MEPGKECRKYHFENLDWLHAFQGSLLYVELKMVNSYDAPMNSIFYDNGVRNHDFRRCQ